ncbi:hypothetical protein ACHQM5_021478 [Ranunculus cassubicifolius]
MVTANGKPVEEKLANEVPVSENTCAVGIKRPREYDVEEAEDENPNKKRIIESLNCEVLGLDDENSLRTESISSKVSSNDENSLRVESHCDKECVLDDTPLETCHDVECSSRVESKLRHEPVVDSTEEENQGNKEGIEVSNDETSIKVESKCSDELVLEAIRAANPIKKPAVESSPLENLLTIASRISNERVQDATEKESPNKKLAEESRNVENSSGVEFRSSECVVHRTETENLNKSPTTGSSNYDNSSRVVSKSPIGNTVDAIEVQNPGEKTVNEFLDDSNAIKIELNESVVDAIEVETPNILEKKSLNDDSSSRVESKCVDECVIDATEIESSDSKLLKTSSDDENSSKEESKCSDECVLDAMEVDTPNKKPAKELLTESCSEVFDLNFSPQENALSSQSISSQFVEGLSRSGDSSTEVVDKEGHCINNSSASLSKSEVILEGSEVPHPCAVRKITFKFSKNKDINNDMSSSQADPSSMEVNNGFSKCCLHKESDINSSERNMLKNRRLEYYFKNVKNFLSTGVLEGVEVKYINQEEKLRGFIKCSGYLCGCALCNFLKVVDAYEFEQHAGCRTTDPNEHVYLNNGKSIHTIVQELKNIPVSSLDEMVRLLVGPLFNENSHLQWKESADIENLQIDENRDENEKESHVYPVHISQSTMSISSEDTEDSLGSPSRFTMQKFPIKQKISAGQGIFTERSLVSNTLSTSRSTSDRVKKTVKKRDNELHRLLFMPNGLPDGAELAYCIKGQRLLKGYKQGNGILCSCCKTEISPSQFEAHAGWSVKRQPYRHIYNSAGISLHELSLSLANTRNYAVKKKVDKCIICEDSGNLIFCNSCSLAYHTDCLGSDCTPDGENCPRCKNKSRTGLKIASTESMGSGRPLIIRLTRVKAQATETGGCVICRTPDFSVEIFDDRTVMLCDQCEKEYHVGCLRKHGFCDLKELPKGAWFCTESCNRIQKTLWHLVSQGAKQITNSMSSTINKKLIEKGLACEVGGDVRWQLLSGKIPDHKPLLSSVAAIFRDSFDPIVEPSGTDLIPPMVYGQNIQGNLQEFGGIYCAVLSVNSIVVSAGLFRIFGREIAELPLVATTKESRGKGYFQVLFACIETLLSTCNVVKLVLPAAEQAESIWIRKFGFRKLPMDQFEKYTKDVQVISFKGSMMLEKDVLRSL